MQRFLNVPLLLVAIATTAVGAGPDEAASPLVMRSGRFTFFRKEVCFEGGSQGSAD